MSMTLISTVTVGSAQTSIVFSSIPATFTDLLLVFSVRSNRSGQIDDPINFVINGTSSGYSARLLEGSGSSVTSYSGGSTFILGGYMPAGATTANTFGNGSVYIPNYRVSQSKSVSIDHVHENNATTAYQDIIAGLWANNAAINEISLNAQIGQIVQHSSASLYGIQSGSSGGVIVS